MWWLRVGSQRGKYSAPPSSRACVPLGYLGTAKNRRIVPTSAGVDSMNLRVQSDVIFVGSCLCIGKKWCKKQGYLQLHDGEY